MGTGNELREKKEEKGSEWVIARETEGGRVMMMMTGGGGGHGMLYSRIIIIVVKLVHGAYAVRSVVATGNSWGHCFFPST